MARDKISKQTVKDYLDIKNSELGSQLKDNIDRKENWGDFKSEFAVLVANYANKPTPENKKKVESLISANYILNRIFAEDALDTIFKGLGIVSEQERKAQIKSNRENYNKAVKRALYARIGIEYSGDIVESREKEYQEMLDRKYGIKRRTIKKPEANKEEPKKFKAKEDGAVKKALKKAYFKLTASMLHAPGKVPPEILAENRNKINDASGKLDKVIGELKRAQRIVSEKNKAHNKNTPDDIKEIYEQFNGKELDEEGIEGFEETLDEKASEQIWSMRDAFENLQKSKLEEKLRKLAETRFSSLEEEEIDAEIEYAILDSKIDKEGMLVLPARSIFKDILFDENGELRDEQADITDSLITYSSATKVSELSDEEITRLGRHFRDLSNMDPSSKEYAVAKFLQENPEMLPDESDQMMSEIETTSIEYTQVKNIAEEVEFTHKLMIAEDVKVQFENIQEIIKGYDDKEQADGELNKDDTKKREIALKIARQKVNSLEKSGLSRVIAEGEKKSKGVIKRARSILLPQLENARSKGTKRLEKEFSEPEDQEPAE